MNERGGIKTSIFLFSLLLVGSLFLFFFVQSLYVESKNAATTGLINMNDCLDMFYEVDEKGSSVRVLNGKSSNKIISMNVNGIDVPVAINPGESEEIDLNKPATIYPNNCEGLSKVIDDVA